MKTVPGRRFALMTMGLGMVAGATGFAAVCDGVANAAEPSLLPPDAKSLEELTARLSRAPRRRDFKTVPMILNDPDQWDHAALSEVIAYRGAPKQVWDNTGIASPWLNDMRNSLNTQVWSFRHPDFLVVSLTHGTAHLALFGPAMCPLLKPFARLLVRLLPARIDTADPSQPLYLDWAARETPSIALAGAAREALRMVDVFEAMLRGALDSLNRGDRKRVTATARMDNVLDRLDTAIKEYLTSLDTDALDDTDHRRLSEILAFTTNLEHAGGRCQIKVSRAKRASSRTARSCCRDRVLPLVRRVGSEYPERRPRDEMAVED
jgi:hypothetical protein